SDMLRQIYGRKVPRNTIHYWTKNYRDLFPYLKVKKEERIKILQHDYNGSILRVHLSKLRSITKLHPELSQYIFRASRGLRKSSLQGENMENMLPHSEVEIHGLLDERTFEDRTENRIAAVLGVESRMEILRDIMINDHCTICKNLPVFGTVRGKGRYFDTVQLLQVEGKKITLMHFLEGNEDEQKILKRLIGIRKALELRSKTRFNDVRIGAFDRGSTWTIRLNTHK
ncbi:MAG: hypothetical protein U9R75_02770, partial [Candidatus Thermoplasmatota archaeon]|nr:hypothetical protein [Candidatus Thermoplasmatota archaeon]